jgi:hypothetical protein
MVVVPHTKIPARRTVSSDVEKLALERLKKKGKLDRFIKTTQGESDLGSLEHRLTRSIATDIYPVPEVLDQSRKDAAEFNFQVFNETYLSKRFTLRWAKTHYHSMEVMQNAVLRGDGQYAFADPRGSGKTSLSEALALWCLLYGHRKFVLVMGATAAHAIEIFQSINIEIETNLLLLDDFPEVCYPIRMLNGSYLRSRFQHIKGENTRIEFRRDSMCFPIVAGSKVSGSTIKCVSVTGRVRGIKRTTANGESLRPDFLIIDDPQTDASARSPRLTDTRERIILNSVKGLAGPDKQLTAIMPCTVIHANDLAERFLDNVKRPEWQGKRNKLLEKFPDNMDMWNQYAKLRADSFRKGLGGRLATDFYVENRSEMDRGATVSWQDRYDPRTQVSAIQYALDLWIDDPITFASEYQNEPLLEANVATGRINLQAKEIIKRTSGYPDGVVPTNTQFLTAGIDIQEKILYYAVTAWVENFGGVIVDYGTYPKQTLPYFNAQNPPVPLVSQMPELAGTLSPQVFKGLSYLQSNILSRRYRRDESKTDYLSLDKACVDKNWNVVSDAVELFCKENEQRNIYVPSVGKGIGPAFLPMEEWAVKPGEKKGANWRYRVANSGIGRNVVFDTNFWKSRIGERLISPKGMTNALLLYGDDTVNHKLIADHLSSEYAETTFGRGRSVDVWQSHVSMPDNHMWDCYDDRTEVLTKNGWKPFPLVNMGDELATVDLETDKIEYQYPYHVIHKPYTGEMVKIGGVSNSRVDVLVTPSHRMVVYAGQNSNTPTIKLAKDLTIWDRLKPSAKWDGIERSYVYLDACGARLPACKIDAKAYARLLGWIASEGSVYKNKNGGSGVFIAQSRIANPVKFENIKELLRENFTWNWHCNDTGFTIGNAQVFKIGMTCGRGSKNKCVPQWIKDSSPDIIAEFLDAIVDGDGWRHRNHEAYATVSKKLSDDIQELYLKCGYGVSECVREAKAYAMHGRSGNNTQAQYHVHRKKTKYLRLRDGQNKSNVSREYYNGNVHCASVLNGTLIVRRNGKVLVSGNCLVMSAVAASMCGLELHDMVSGSTTHARVKKERRVISADAWKRKS